MNRTLFYTTSTVDNIQEFDYLYNSLANFEMNYPKSYIQVESQHLQRPDLISYQAYNTVDYWWLICYVNNIHDIFEDLEIGMTLTIPNLLDIFEFGKKYRIR